MLTGNSGTRRARFYSLFKKYHFLGIIYDAHNEWIPKKETRRDIFKRNSQSWNAFQINGAVETFVVELSNCWSRIDRASEMPGFIIIKSATPVVFDPARVRFLWVCAFHHWFIQLSSWKLPVNLVRHFVKRVFSQSPQTLIDGFNTILQGKRVSAILRIVYSECE